MNVSSGNVVDSKIVELQFQNQNFESNAKTSLSTLERLKKALNFSVKDIGAFDTISKGVETATSHTHGLTNAFGNLNNALGNVKNVAVFSMIADEAIKAKNAVESFVKDVTLDPISQGWQKYADKTEAVQTIMAATKQDFSDTAEQMAVVNEQLEKLNWFTDETSYNFVDMVGNIGKFTANRIPLDQAVTAMEGISTWAAISGQNAQSASHAMYNLAQAIGVGAVKLIDWRSVENANMGTAEFKETAIQTAEELGTLTKVSDDAWKTLDGSEVSVRNFTDALKDEWFTSEVLVKTLEKYGGFTDKLHGYMQEMNGDITTSEVLNYIDDFKAGTIDWKDAIETTGLGAARLKEVLSDLGSEQMEFGRKAFVAAQQAVTFEQAIESVKDTASTAWMNTFEILFGDFQQAKVLWTDLANNLWDVFVGGISDTNEALKEGFAQTQALSREDYNNLENLGIVNPGFMTKLREVAKEHGVIMNDMLTDEQWLATAFTRGQLSVGLVEEAYENMFKSGVKVDEELLSQAENLKETDESFQSLLDTVAKYADQDVGNIVFGNGEHEEGSAELEAAIDNVVKALGLTQEEGEKAIAVLQSLGILQGDVSGGYADMSNEELKALGWTDEQIKKFRELDVEGKVLAEDLKSIGVDPLSGGEHWMHGLYNIMDSIVELTGVFQEAWGEIFPPASADTIYNVAKSFDETTGDVLEFIKTSDTLKDSFKAVASVVDMALSNIKMIGEAAALKGIIMFASAIAGAVTSFVKLTGTLAVGASVFEFVTGLISGLGLNIGGIVDKVAKAITAFAAWAKSTDIVNKALSGINKAGEIVGRLLVQLFEKITGINLGEFFGNFGTKAQEVFGKVGNFVDGAITKFDAFVEKLKALGGVSIDNFVDVLKMLKDDALEYLSNFEGFQKLKKGFEDFKTNAKTTLSSVGINVDDFTKKFDTIKSVFGTLGTSIQTRFSKAFEKVKTGFSSFAETGQKKIGDFVNKVKGMGGIKLDNIIDIFGSLKTDVLDYFANWEGFTAIKDSLKGVWEDLTTEAGKFGVDLSGLTTVFNTVGSVASKVFNKMKSVGGTTFKVFSSFGLSFAKSFTGLFDKMSTKVTPFISAAGERISGFVESLGNMDTISLDSISGLFKGLWDDITTYFKDVDLVQMLKDSFSGFWDQMRTNLKDIGLDLDWLVDIFETIGNVGLSAFGLVGDGVNAAITKIKELWKSFTELPIVQSAIDKFQTAFGKISEGWGDFVAGAGTKFGEFLTHVQELGGVSFENLGAIFDLFKNDVLGYFGDWEGFGAIKEAFSGIWEDIKAGLADYGIDIDAIEAKITGFVDNVKAKIDEFKLSEPFEKFLNIFTGGNQVDEHGVKLPNQSIADRVLDFFDSIRTTIEDFKMPDIGSIFSDFSKSVEEIDAPEGAEEKVGLFQGIINSIHDFFQTNTGKMVKIGIKAALFAVAARKVWKTFKNFDIIGAIVGYLNGMAADAKASAHIKNAGAVALLAVSVGILAKSVIEISEHAKENDLWPAVGVVGALAAIVIALDGLVSLIPGGGIALGGLAATIAAFALLLNTLNGLDWDSLSTGFKKFGDTLASIDTDSIDTGKIAQIAGALNTLSSAGLKNSIGTAIQEFAGIDAESSLTLLADSMDDLAVGLAKFVAAVNTIDFDSLSEANIGKISEITGIMDFAAWGGLLNSIGTAIEYPYTGMTSLESYSKGIEAFSESLNTWCENVNGLGEIPMPEGVDTLIKKIDAVNWSGVKSAIGDAAVRLLNGDEEGAPQTAMDQFNRNLSLLSIGLHQWRDDVNDLANIPMPTGVDELIDKVGTVSNEGVFQAIDNWSIGLITGGDSDSGVGLWKENVNTFATALNNWVDRTNELGDIDMPTGVDELNEKLKAASETSKGIAGDSFTVVKWFGADALPTLALFNLYVDMFATALNTWKEKTNGLGEIDMPTGVDDLIKKVDEASAVGTEGSLKDAFTRLFTKMFGGESEGEQQEVVTSMTTFSTHVGQLADALSTWQEKVGDLDEVTIDPDGIQNLIEAVDSVKGDGGLFGAIDTFLNGAPDFEDFGNKAEALGTAVDKFATGLGDETDIERLNKATTLLLGLTNLVRSFEGAQMVQFTDEFGIKLNELASIINGFVEMIAAPDQVGDVGAGAEGIANAISTLSDVKFENIELADEGLVDRLCANIDKIIAAFDKLSGTDFSGADKLKGAFDSVGDTDVSGADKKLAMMEEQTQSSLSNVGSNATSGLIEGMSDTSGVTDAAGNLASAALDAVSDTSGFSEKGTAMVTAVVDAMRSAASSSGVADIMSGMVSEALGALSDGSWQASEYGGYLASGFASGIALKSYLAVQAAAAMAKAAAEAIKNNLHISSPSKVTYELGTYFGQGFGNAIEDYSDTAYKQASALSSTALKALGDSLNVIDDVFASEDIYEPLIRPVLDTSEIQNGAGMIGEILSSKAPVRLFGDVGEIKSTLDERKRAASLEDVVSALGLVERSASNIRGGDTYNVNGVTYDDGSNISDAVRVLIHAATVERRR